MFFLSTSDTPTAPKKSATNRQTNKTKQNKITCVSDHDIERHWLFFDFKILIIISILLLNVLSPPLNIYETFATGN